MGLRPPKTLEEVINRGAPVAADSKNTEDKEWTTFCLRIRKDLLVEIEDSLQEKFIGMNRTVWILQAIQEKLKREAQ